MITMIGALAQDLYEIRNKNILIKFYSFKEGI